MTDTSMESVLDVLLQLIGPDPVNDADRVEACEWLIRVLNALVDCGYRVTARD